jgi:hypothetical protein
MSEWLADKAILLGSVAIALPAVVLTLLPVLI